MKHLKSFESIGTYIQDPIKQYINTDILMDILSEIKDETNSDFNLYQDEFINGPICYGGFFDPSIPISYLGTIQRAMQYYYDETGDEIIVKISTWSMWWGKDNDMISWLFFIRNDDNEFTSSDFFNLLKKLDINDSIFLDRNGIIENK